MKKLFRGDVLSWLEGEGVGARDRVERARERAREARELVRAGAVHLAEPWLPGALDRVAALEPGATDAALRALRGELGGHAREGSAWPFRLVDRTVLPLPASARPGFVSFAARGLDRFLVAVEEFREVAAAPSRPGRPRFASRFRLFSLEGHRQGLRELLAFDAGEQAGVKVHLLPDPDDVLLLVSDRLISVAGDGAYEELAVLQRPRLAGPVVTVRGAVLRGSLLYASVDEQEDGEDEGCGLYAWELDGRLERRVGLAGHQGVALEVDGGDAWVSDLLVVHRLPLAASASLLEEPEGDEEPGEPSFENARGDAPQAGTIEVSERDLRPYFLDVPHTPVERLARLGDDLVVSNGRKLVRLSRDLGEVIDEHVPPQEHRTLEITGGHIMTSRHDVARGALVVDVWKTGGGQR